VSCPARKLLAFAFAFGLAGAAACKPAAQIADPGGPVIIDGAVADAGEGEGDAEVEDNDGGGGGPPDNGRFKPRDSGPRDLGADSGAVVIGGCPTGEQLSPGSEGPVNLAQVQGHGLPGCYRCTIATGDFDADGRIDVAIAGSFDTLTFDGFYQNHNVLRVYKNISCPNEEIRFELALEMPNTVGGGGAIVVSGNLNGDALPDLALQLREGTSPDSDTAAFINQGNWQFTKIALGAFDTQSTSLGMTRGDIDGDGIDDLALNSDAQGLAPGLWYKWNGSEFESRQTDFPHRIAYGGTIASGDLDGDHLADLVVGGNSRAPFGSYDCTDTLLYGQIHFNSGQNIEAQGHRLGAYAVRPNAEARCDGMDNASVQLADMDSDGTLDIIIAGAADAFPGPMPGPPASNGSHYDFVVLFNRDGTGRNFVAWENAGEQYVGGTTNGGTGNLDTPSTAVGDLNGDGLQDVFMQGHHRDYATDHSRYVYNSRLFLNVAGNEFIEIELGFMDVGEGGQAIEDFNNDGKKDLIFAGASLPFHSNGANPDDNNDMSTLFAFVYRNTRP
jgi:hypothetical protein